MELFSHNTMSYRKPLQWWLRPLYWIGRCQNKALEEQYNNGARYFDLRIKFKKEQVYFAHGIFNYNASDIVSILEWMSIYAKGVRIILEKYNNEEDIENFKVWCTIIEKCGINCFGGKTKQDNKLIYEFKNTSPEIIHLYSSTTSLVKWINWLDDLYPRLYALLYNRKNIQKYRHTNKILGIDFI